MEVLDLTETTSHAPTHTMHDYIEALRKFCETHEEFTAPQFSSPPIPQGVKGNVFWQAAKKGYCTKLTERRLDPKSGNQIAVWRSNIYRGAVVPAPQTQMIPSPVLKIRPRRSPFTLGATFSWGKRNIDFRINIDRE